MVNPDYSIEEIPVIGLVIFIGRLPSYLAETPKPYLVDMVRNLYVLPLLIGGSGFLARMLRPPSIERDTPSIHGIDILSIGPTLACCSLVLRDHLMNEIHIVLHTFFPSSLSISYWT